MDQAAEPVPAQNASAGHYRTPMRMPGLTLATEIPVYFAHAHSPWERGTNENTNGIVREYFPKGTEITGDIHYLQAVADEINDRPRAILGFRTPAEVFAELLLADNPGDNLSSIASTG